MKFTNSMKHETKENSRLVFGVAVKTQSIVITDANILEVETGTTGFRGGDTGHGGRTYFRLQDHASTDMNVRVNGGEWEDLMSGGSVEIAFGGDAELNTFISALEFTLKELKKATR